MRIPRPAVAVTVVVTGLALIAPPVPASGSAASPGAGPAAPTVAASYEELALNSAPGTRSATTTAANTRPFGLVGVTWPHRASSAEIVVKVRVRRDGRWTAWERLAVEDEHGPGPAQEGRPRSGTEPFWVGTASGVEASLTTLDGTTVRDAKVALIQPGSGPGDEAVEAETTTPPSPSPKSTAAGRAPYPMPGMISRRGWGADEKLRSHNGAACAKPKYTATVQAAFVHHTVDRNDYTRAQVPAMIRSMYAYHVKSRGWCDLGYNFLVDRFGRAFEGRYGGAQLPVLGAHTGAYNSRSFGVSLIGNFDTARPTAAILETTARIIAWKLDANYRYPSATVTLNGRKLNVVSGHRDAKATVCPGKYLYQKLGWLRQRSAALMGYSVSTEIYRYARLLGGYKVIGQPFWGEHPTRTGRGAWFGARDLYWSVATGTHSLRGGFRARYRRLGPADGVLGLPTADERAGRVAGTRVQPFRYGALYWSKATGAQPTYGQIARRYSALGAERSRLGLPTTAPYAVTGGLRQSFRHGLITWSSRTGGVFVDYR